MRLELCLDQGSTRRWHLDLLRQLAGVPDLETGIRWASEKPEPLPSCVSTLFSLERLLHRLDRGGFEPVGPEDLAQHVGHGGTDPDIVLDLAGGRPAAGRRSWRLTFDGAAGEVPLVAALLSGRTPLVAVTDVASGEPVALGQPGTETPHIIAAAYDDIVARAATLIVSAVTERGARLDRAAETSTLACGDVALFGTKAVARAALHRLYRLLTRAPHWRTGWRFVDGPGVVELGAHPKEGWRTLPDDGLRFYADPFPVVVRGRTWLFLEELEHRTGKGVISAVPFGPEGPVGTPRVVMEGPVHLSYPFVFEDGGEIWMIPESCAAGAIDLYRSTSFPGGWVHEARLVDGLEVSDATPFRHGGRWWMTASVRDGGSYSDALHLWSATRLLGPWTPHAGNPVLVDVASARPAGRVVEVGDRLVRPVQDCRGGYGSAIGLAEITRLDDGGFEQRLAGRVAPGPLWPGRRLHTLNRAGPLECLDGSALSLRLGSRKRAEAAPAHWPAPDALVGQAGAVASERL